MPAGAFAVHQLRYWLAFGSRAAAELQAQGHSYLHSVVPWIVLLLALSIGAFLLSLGRAFGGRSSLSRHTLSFATLWLLCSAGLVAIYVSQEFLEGLFATGHPGGLIGIFGYGGWWSIPAAIAVGLCPVGGVPRCAAGARGGRRSSSPWPARRPVGRAAPCWLRRDVPLPALAPLADGWSGGPSRLSSRAEPRGSVSARDGRRSVTRDRPDHNLEEDHPRSLMGRARVVAASAGSGSSAAGPRPRRRTLVSARPCRWPASCSSTAWPCRPRRAA